MAVLAAASAIRQPSGPAPSPPPEDEVCDQGFGVPDSASDCAILLRAQSTLAGTATLDWDASRPITSWQGVFARDGAVTQLRLSDSGLTGSIPAELGNLSRLEELYLNGNVLTGNIPAELGNLSRLEELHLGSNRLTGSIPAELGGLPWLEELYLNGNLLTGSIPAELGNLPWLEELHLGDNLLTGASRRKLGSPSRLEELHLGDNLLTGSIPAELAGLAMSLLVLDLNSNLLTGASRGTGPAEEPARTVAPRHDLNGCVPNGVPFLGNTRRYDLDQLGLAACAP